ncbi:hypothetical protein ACLI4Z_18815 [Natrialbaceae archaeon A-arb3/5]
MNLEARTSGVGAIASPIQTTSLVGPPTRRASGEGNARNRRRDRDDPKVSNPNPGHPRGDETLEPGWNPAKNEDDPSTIDAVAGGPSSSETVDRDARAAIRVDATTSATGETGSKRIREPRRTSSTAVRLGGRHSEGTEEKRGREEGGEEQSREDGRGKQNRAGNGEKPNGEGDKNGQQKGGDETIGVTSDHVMGALVTTSDRRNNEVAGIVRRPTSEGSASLHSGISNSSEVAVAGTSTTRSKQIGAVPVSGQNVVPTSAEAGRNASSDREVSSNPTCRRRETSGTAVRLAGTSHREHGPIELIVDRASNDSEVNTVGRNDNTTNTVSRNDNRANTAGRNKPNNEARDNHETRNVAIGASHREIVAATDPRIDTRDSAVGAVSRTGTHVVNLRVSKAAGRIDDCVMNP